VGLFPGVVKTRRGIDLSVNGGGCFPRVVKISLVYIEFVIQSIQAGQDDTKNCTGNSLNILKLYTKK